MVGQDEDLTEQDDKAFESEPGTDSDTSVSLVFDDHDTRTEHPTMQNTPWISRLRSYLSIFALIILIGFAVSTGNMLISKHAAYAEDSLTGRLLDISNVECFAKYPLHESFSSGSWWNKTNVSYSVLLPDDPMRYAWFRDRKPFEPIVGDETIIAGVIYTLSAGLLKMTVLFPPLHPVESRVVHVTIRNISHAVVTEASCLIVENTWHCPLRMPSMDAAQDYTYEVTYQPKPDGVSKFSYKYNGNIPKQVAYPRIAALSCFGVDDAKDKALLIQALVESKPDLLSLQGDQTYMNVLAYGFVELMYTMNEITRNIPTLVQMDDHDYGQGNLYGAALGAENSGDGFFRPPCIVNAIQKLAMSHMPDPVSDQHLDNGIDEYFTSYTYGSVEFAVLEARKFKSESEEVGSLLGHEQEAWLKEWCSASTSPLRVILTQTPFASLATNITRPGGSTEGYIGPARPLDTTDTNGFPPDGRKRFMDIAHGCSPLILSGDQHLGMVASYDNYGISECASPAVVNDQFWRLNFEPINTPIVDYYNETHTMHRVWNMDDWVWQNFLPEETQLANDRVKAARADGFLMVNLDGQAASCEMHAYRLGHELVWSVTVPAMAKQA
jgi:hypothetical protein